MGGKVRAQWPPGPAAHSRAAGGMRRGNMGHLTRIANAVAQNLEKGPMQTHISDVIRGEPFLPLLPLTPDPQQVVTALESDCFPTWNLLSGGPGSQVSEQTSVGGLLVPRDPARCQHSEAQVAQGSPALCSGTTRVLSECRPPSLTQAVLQTFPARVCEAGGAGGGSLCARE